MHRRGHRGYRDVVRFDQVRLARAELCGWAQRVSLVLTWHDQLARPRAKFSKASGKSHDASLFAPHRRHAAQERRTYSRCVPSHLRSALGYRDRGLLPRAVRQYPPQPRPGEQVVEGRLQDCRCVPSQVRLRRVPDQGFLGAGYSHHRHDGQRRSSVSTLRESRWTSWWNWGIPMQLRCFPGECKAAEVDAREQPSLEYTDVLYRSRKWAIARSSVLARERVPLGLEHVPLCRR